MTNLDVMSIVYHSLTSVCQKGSGIKHDTQCLKESFQFTHHSNKMMLEKVFFSVY